MDSTGDLVGHSITHIWDPGPWGGSGYRHDFLSEDVLAWTGVAGEREGMSDHERFDALFITPTIVQIIFIEHKKRLPKTVTYDFSTGRVFGVLLPGGETAFTLLGRIADTDVPVG